MNGHSGHAPTVEVDHVTLRFDDVTALDDLTVTFDGGKVHGLLGRNGAGKSSLLAIIAAFRRASAGEVRIGGSPVFEHPHATQQVCLIREAGDTVDGSERIEAALRFAAAMRPHWNASVAATLLDRLELSPKAKIGELSRGKRSALGVVLGIAARAPVTIFDESYLGMDAPSRYAFYDALLADVMEAPRTVILSTHLIEEVGALFERVTIIDRGRLVLQDDAEALRAQGVTVTGPAEQVDGLVRAAPGAAVLSASALGRTKSVVLYGELNGAHRQLARTAGLDVAPISLQDLYVHLTQRNGSTGESQ